MKSEDILEQPLARLSQGQREQYFVDGFLTIPKPIPAA